MSKVRNVEKGVRFKHPTYGVLEVVRFIQTGEGRIASDIWHCKGVDSNENLTLTDWAIMDCEEVAD